MASVPGIEASQEAQALLRLQDSVRVRKGILACGDEYAAAVASDGRVLFAGTNAFGQEAASDWRNMRGVFGGRTYLLGLTADGSVRYAGQDVCNVRAGVAHWSGVRLLACSETHVAALFSGGRVVCAGGETMPYGDTAAWTDVRDICCGRSFTLGLTADGTVLVAGGSYIFRKRIAMWGRVAGLFADADGDVAYAITADGRLVGTCSLPHQTKKWNGLVAVAGSGHCVYAITAQGQLNGGHRAITGTAYVALAAGVSHLLTVDWKGRVSKRDVYRWQKNRSGEIDVGLNDLSGWPCLYERFETFATDRRNAETTAVRDGHMFLLRMTQAIRCGRRLSCGERMTACITADGHVLATGGLEKPAAWSGVVSLSCGASHLLALRRDGKVLADGNDTGGSCRTDDWSRVVSVLACRDHSLALCGDGRVLYAGAPDAPCGQVSDWTHVCLLRATDRLTVGVTTDGHILTCGQHPALDKTRDGSWSDDWVDVQDVVMSEHIIAGLRRDGRVAVVSDVAGMESVVRDWQDIRMLSVGDRHLVGLNGCGKVVSAGDNARGQCNVSDWSRVVWVSCGADCTWGVCADGTATAAGQMAVASADGSGRTDWVCCDASGLTHVWTLRCGSHHVAALTESGQILTFGQDMDGQCRGTASFAVFRDVRQYDGITIFGNMTDGNGDSPSEAIRDTNKSAVSGYVTSAERAEWEGYAPYLRSDAEQLAARLRVGKQDLMILTADGTYRWLFDERKLIRDGDEVIRRVSTDRHGEERLYDAVGGPGLANEVTSGAHMVGLCMDGTVVAAGCNTSGECLTSDWSRVIQVVALPGVTFGLRADGRILTTGKRGRILGSLRDVRAMAGGNDRVVLVLSDGSLRVHMHGSEFLPEQIEGIRLFHPGIGSSVLSRFHPQMDQAEGARCVRRLLGCGITHVVRVGSDGGVYAVGSNSLGQCSVGDWQKVTAVACGLSHTAAVSEGRVVAAGMNRDGQCDADQLNAALVNPPDGQPRTGAALFRSVACGYAHTVALRGDGRVFAVGASPDGRCDTAAWHTAVDIACGVRHTAAVLADGHCVACGDNQKGQCAVAAWENVTMVACGEFHTVGLTSDGRVLAAGSVGAECCRVDDLRNVISVACLPETTVCVHADGHLTVRGGDSVLAEAVASIRDAVAVDGKEYRLAVLTVDRRILLFPNTDRKSERG